MKIAVFHNLPFGGGQRVMNEQIARLGDQVEAVYTFSDSCQTSHCPVFGEKLELMRLLKSPFGRLNGLINVCNLIKVEHASRKLAMRIDEQGYNALLVHPCSVTQTPAILRWLKTPTIYYCHEPLRAMHEAMEKSGVFLPISDPFRCIYSYKAVKQEYTALSMASLVLCNSFYIREYLLRTYGINAQVNYPGVDVNIFHQEQVEKLNFVLSVGRLSKLKGHDFVLESVALIPQTLRPTVGIVCGLPDPGAKAELAALAEQMDVEVEFYENISDEKLVELYNRAKATLVAAILEPLGLTPLESMAAGHRLSELQKRGPERL